jgi:hypothetical protein
MAVALPDLIRRGNDMFREQKKLGRNVVDSWVVGCNFHCPEILGSQNNFCGDLPSDLQTTSHPL